MENRDTETWKDTKTPERRRIETQKHGSTETKNHTNAQRHRDMHTVMCDLSPAGSTLSRDHSVCVRLFVCGVALFPSKMPSLFLWAASGSWRTASTFESKALRLGEERGEERWGLRFRTLCDDEIRFDLRCFTLLYFALLCLALLWESGLYEWITCDEGRSVDCWRRKDEKTSCFAIMLLQVQNFFRVKRGSNSTKWDNACTWTLHPSISTPEAWVWWGQEYMQVRTYTCAGKEMTHVRSV